MAVEKGAKGRGWVTITASQIESRPQNDRFTPNGALVRTIPLFQGNLGESELLLYIIWPEYLHS